MSRIRTIKPDFWSSEQVMSVSMQARLLFIGIWNFADDAGRFRWKPATLKAQVLPCDDVTVAQVAKWMDELAAAGLIERYVSAHGGLTEDSLKAHGVVRDEYGFVTGWHHQNINRPTPSKYPAPDKNMLVSRSAHGGLTEDSLKAHGGLTAGSSPLLPTGIHPAGSARARDSKADAEPEVQIPDTPFIDGASWAGAFGGAVASAFSMDRRPDSALEEMCSTVRREFAQRFEQAEGSLWTLFGSPDVTRMATWCLSLSGDRLEALRRTLDTFFADDWVRSQHYPIGHLARYPQKYLEPRGKPTREVETIESLRARGVELVKRKAPIEEIRAINARIAELEEQAERSRRRA